MSIATYLLLAGKSALKFCLKHWVWFALAAALLFARHLGVQSAERAAAIADLTKERDEAVASALAWKEYGETSQRLAEATINARAVERAQLLSIERALGSTKQGIANAPGADAPYRYSDSLYRFMRERPESAGPAAEAAPDVVGR